MTKKFIVNGQEYSSVEEMPPDVREMFGRMTRDLPDGGGHGANQAFEVEIIEGDTPGMRASGTMRTAGRSGMSSSPRTTDGSPPSHGRLGWFVALILGLVLIWVLMAGCAPCFPLP